MFAYKEPDRVGKLACLRNLFHATAVQLNTQQLWEEKSTKPKYFKHKTDLDLSDH